MGLMSSETKSSETKEKKRRVRGALGRTLMKVPLVRRLYARRVLKFIDKSRTKGRKLPPELYELSRQLSRVPESDRASALEAALRAGPQGVASMPGSNRQLRRAASAQQRQSGKGQGRYRPGLAGSGGTGGAGGAGGRPGAGRPSAGGSKPARQARRKAR